MSLHDRIKEARKNRGLTQEQLGNLIGVAKTTITGYEKTREPSAAKLGEIADVLGVDVNFLYQDEVKEFHKNRATIEELEKLVKPYRLLDSHGRELVDMVLNKEAERMKELETYQATVIDIQPRLGNNTRLIEYHQSASAGTGVFILGNEGVDQIPIPDTPENRKVDYAIKVSGNSMEPDYYDGDIVLVSQKVELNHGDVGIFIINNNAYIKEYGETELISRNPEADNITISEYDNIVCMGKVVGKYGE